MDGNPLDLVFRGPLNTKNSGRTAEWQGLFRAHCEGRKRPAKTGACDRGMQFPTVRPPLVHRAIHYAKKLSRGPLRRCIFTTPRAGVSCRKGVRCSMNWPGLPDFWAKELPIPATVKAHMDCCNATSDARARSRQRAWRGRGEAAVGMEVDDPDARVPQPCARSLVG